MSSLGEALETARRAQGWTQEDLAHKAGITQAALSRYEHDLREPSAETLAVLANCLGVTAELLTSSGRQQGAMAVDAHMRRRATAPPSKWRQLEAQLNMLRMHARQLFGEVSMNAQQFVPSIDPIDTDPESAARMVRMQWRMPAGPVRSLIQWLEAAGCLVVEHDFGTSRVDGMSQWIDGHPLIMINVAAPTDRKRLTLAHELAHLVLHSAHATDDVEKDANRFASEFLMPTEVIRPELRGLTLGKLNALKRQWGVSMQAIIEKAFGLGLISATQRARFYQQFSARGWRTNEPASDELPPERVTLPAAIADSLTARGWTQEDIDRVAGYNGAESNFNPFQPSSSRFRLIR